MLLRFLGRLNAGVEGAKSSSDDRDESARYYTARLICDRRHYGPDATQGCKKSGSKTPQTCPRKPPRLRPPMLLGPPMATIGYASSPDLDLDNPV
jgi:hypothetical protein